MSANGKGKRQGPGAKPRVVKFDKGEEGGDIGLPGVVIHVDRDFKLSVGGADSPLTRELKKRFEHFNGLNKQEKSEQVFGGAVRYGPYAMFVLMPAFAFLQMIVYAGGDGAIRTGPGGTPSILSSPPTRTRSCS